MVNVVSNTVGCSGRLPHPTAIHITEARGNGKILGVMSIITVLFPFISNLCLDPCLVVSSTVHLS